MPWLLPTRRRSLKILSKTPKDFFFVGRTHESADKLPTYVKIVY